MKKTMLLDTPFAKARSLNNMLPHALRFLIKNMPEVLIRDENLKSIESIRPASSTPIFRIFQDVISMGKLNNYALLNFSNFKEDIPELMALDEITIDGKYLPNIPSPAQLQKCWLNITPIVGKKTSYNDSLNITDHGTLASLIVRGAFVSSYNDSDRWVSPKTATLIIENYCTTIGHILRQAYMLDYNEQMFVQTLFATYMAQQLGGSDTSMNRPPLLLRCTFLGSAADIIQRLESISKYRDNHGEDILTPSKICHILAAAGPHRMKKFTVSNLYRFLSSSSIDSQTMMIAIDYPPYWAYQMFRLASGYKNPVMSNVIKILGSKNKLTEFAMDIIQSNIVIDGVRR